MKKQLTAVTVLTFAAVSSAMAALSTDVSTAMSDGLADVKTLAGLGLIITIAVLVFRKMRSAA